MNGWDPDGSPRLFCAQVGEEGSPNEYIPSVFVGQAPWTGAAPNPAPPTINFGLSDLSMEFWAKRKLGTDVGEDFTFKTGLLADLAGASTPDSLAIIWNVTANTFDCRIVGLSILGVTYSVEGVWTHYCLNADRDGNAEIFLNNSSRGTVDISGQVAVNQGIDDFYALIGESSSVGDYVVDQIPPVVIGPIAIHNRILTAAEREASRVGRTVQNLGSAVTLIHLDWKVVGHDSWEDDPNNLLGAFRFGLSVPRAAPVGTEGNVFVRDNSGNANHWTMPVSTAYGTALANRANVNFGVDNYFA